MHTAAEGLGSLCVHSIPYCMESSGTLHQDAALTKRFCFERMRRHTMCVLSKQLETQKHMGFGYYEGLWVLMQGSMVLDLGCCL